MTILEKIDFEPGSGKYEAAVILLNNQMDVDCSDKMKELFMNATVHFLKHSVINDIMQVQPFPDESSILFYLRTISDNDNKLSIAVLEDLVTVDTHENDNVFYPEKLQDLDTVIDYNNLIVESFVELENKMINDVVEQSTKVELSKNTIDDGSILIHIISQGNNIARQTRRGAGNIILMSSDTFKSLENITMDGYNPIKLNDDGFYYFTNAKIKIHDELGDNILIGYNNISNMFKVNTDGGGFFVPYRLFDNIRLILNAITVEPEIHYSSKYATRFYDADKYYTTIQLV
jgi:hypothetical protein